MEQMELREAVAEVKQEDDPFSRINELMHTIQQKQNNMFQHLGNLIASKEFETAKMQVQKLQFLEKLMHECETLEQDLADAL
jgi:DnaJ-domain-containing protein 1